MSISSGLFLAFFNISLISFSFLKFSELTLPLNFSLTAFTASLYLFAALSLISIIPIVGDAIGKGGKIAILLSKLGKTGKYIEKGAKWAGANKQVFKAGADWGREFKGMLRRSVKDTDAVFAFVAETAENPEMVKGVPKMKQALADFVNSPDDDLEAEDPEVFIADLGDVDDDVEDLQSDEMPEEEQAISERDITKDFLKLIY